MKRLSKYTLSKRHEPQTLSSTQHRRSKIRVLASITMLACTLQAHSVFALFVNSASGIDTGTCATSAAPTSPSAAGPWACIDGVRLQR